MRIGNYNQEKKVESGFDPLSDLGDVPYNPMIAYGQSKTANLWMANEIERRYAGQGLHRLCIHPGNIQTDGWANMDPAVMEKFPPLLSLEPSAAQGSATQVLAAVGKDYEGVGGFYLDDCGVSQPIPDDAMVGLTGYRPWIYSFEGEKKLWADSLEFVGLKDDA
ncbi:hypothetical protein LTR17_024340 [Elasticomyces elasticus]|nr:hypothetical protein LTR17_024340 [Elasticomyces elasticus]